MTVVAACCESVAILCIQPQLPQTKRKGGSVTLPSEAQRPCSRSWTAGEYRAAEVYHYHGNSSLTLAKTGGLGLSVKFGGDGPEKATKVTKVMVPTGEM